MPLGIAARPGAKERDVLVDEATAERIQRDLTVILQGIRAAKREMAAMLTPRGEHPYPAGPVVDSRLWRCAQCHGQCIGGEPEDHLCSACAAMPAPDAAEDDIEGAPMFVDDGREAADPGHLEDTAAQAEDEDGDPFIRPEKCGSRPYPAGSEGDDGTECVLPKGHDGPHDDGVVPFDEPAAARPSDWSRWPDGLAVPATLLTDGAS